MLIGQQIKKARLAQGATLEQIAHEANINVSNLSRIERNKQDPTTQMLKKIADALGVTVGELYGEKKSSSVSKVPASTGQDRRAQLMLKQFKSLNSHNQDIALEIVKVLGRNQTKK